MIDELLIKYASPTLGGIKSGSLFKTYKNNKINLNEEIINCNYLLNTLDVYVDTVYSCDKYDLIYVYRLKMLSNDLSDKNMKDFLRSYNYKCSNIDDYISYLKIRFEQLRKTPHEVGVFLGYPLNDVKSFIKYEGKNYKLSGCWKVYDNVDLCKNKFTYFKIYKKVFSYLYNQGYPLECLIAGK